MSLTKLIVPSYSQMLRGLSEWLDKAQEQNSEAEALLSAQLAPDMLPLSSQISFVCFQAQEAAYRLMGNPIPEELDQLGREGQNAAEQPGSIADAQGRISDALSFLEALEPDALDGAARSIAIKLPNGMIFDMTGEQYVRDWAQAQFYFHLVSAYAILRSQNIDLGKADYVSHMFAYVRPGTMPGS